LPPVFRRMAWGRFYFAAVALLFAVLMALGVWRHRSTVPHWDMWGAYLGFYTRVGQDWHAWWGQDNEHRLILGRLLFWTDLRLFHGSMTLLYALNAAFPLLIVACFVFLLRRLQPWPSASGAWRTALVALLVVLMTSWWQNENFTWAFQGLFWLAYLLPLLAFTLLAHARATGRSSSFWLACLAGVASAAAMANGTLALPLLVVQALLLRLRWRDVGVLLLLAALTLVSYRSGYRQIFPAPDRSSWPDIVRYVLLFLGAPWYFLLQKLAWWPAMVAGAAWMALALVSAVRVLRQRPVQPYAVALLMLLAYIGAAGLGAAYNRISLGVGQALSSRYFTPQVMAWAAMLLLAVHLWPRVLTSRWALGGYALIPLLLLPVQLEGIKVPRDFLIQLRLPALAVQLDVRDFETDAFKRMTFTGEDTFALAEQARREHLAVFGEPDMQLALRHWAGAALAPMPQARCAGALQAVEAIPGVTDAVRVRGWLYDPARQRAPSLVLLTHATVGSRGAALGGLRRSDITQPVDRSERYSGFSGYLQTPAPASGDAAQQVTLTGLIDQQPVCALTLDLRP